VPLGTVISRAVWDDDAGSCIVLRTERGRIGIFSTLMSDLVLLVLMLFGLLRWKDARRRRSGTWWYLWTQVVISC
jgi:hypothetical protein